MLCYRSITEEFMKPVHANKWLRTVILNKEEAATDAIILYSTGALWPCSSELMEHARHEGSLIRNTLTCNLNPSYNSDLTERK
jgi:hypothetical protein